MTKLPYTLLSFTFLFISILADTTSPPPPPELSPSPSPSPSPSHSPYTSPPGPPSSDPTPSPSYEPKRGFYSHSPAPAADMSHEVKANVEAEEEAASGGGMNGAKKAGIAVGVIAVACVLGVGVMVYKKRQQNVRRAHYGYSARTEFL